MPAPKLRLNIPNRLTVVAEGHFAVASIAILVFLGGVAWIVHILH
ncbi:hypothetical protein BH10PSE4_BH10PSE4_40920 [soil metagenome]